MDINKLTKGSILSESSYFIVNEIFNYKIEVIDDYGRLLSINKEYVKEILISADIYSIEEKKTMTELAELFIASSRIAMTVAFYKKDEPKTKKSYEAEKTAKIEEIQNAKISDVPRLLNDLIENPISRIIPGELRVMKGRHYGNVDELGRIQFVDMEKERGNKEYDERVRLVDPRTISYLIINNVKYSLK